VVFSLFIFLRACLQQELGTRSWDSNQSSHYKIGHAKPDNNPRGTKINMMDKDILLKCCSRNPSHEKGMKLWTTSCRSYDGLPTGEAYSSSCHATPFKVQVNFDIPLFEGPTDEDVEDKWLDMLKGYFPVHNFSDKENITFSLLKVVPHVKNWWDTYSEERVMEEYIMFVVALTWDSFQDSIK
jgi:hypothetical protein